MTDVQQDLGHGRIEKRTCEAIENNLHWCLDVIMREDGQLNYIGNAAKNMSMMKKIALGMFAN